jgi:hypothetical protein
MFCYLILLTILFGLVIFICIRHSNIKKTDFKNKILILETQIDQLNQKLEIKNKKVKILDTLKIKMNLSNKLLADKIEDLNVEMFSEMFPKKNS